MTEIRVTTQQELDETISRKDLNYQDFEIIIDSPRGVWVTISDSKGLDVRASGSASVEACGSASVRACGSATVEWRTDMAMGYRVGSPQAADAYDRWLDRQADEHMEALYGDDEDRDAQGWSYEPDPEEAYARMMADCMEREAEETWH